MALPEPMDNSFLIGPSIPHLTLPQWRSIWRKCRDVLAGEEAIKLSGTMYLPKVPRMSDDEYEAYKTRALFYGAGSRTVNGLVGSLLRKPPVIRAPDDQAIDDLEALVENITQTGVNLSGFARDIVTEVLSVGRVGVLVDAPPASPKLLDPMPYARLYLAENILNWRSHFEGGVPILDQVMLLEQLEQPANSGFGVDIVTQYRELTLDDQGNYVQRVWVIDPPVDEGLEPSYRIVGEVVPTFRGKALKYLPFFFVGTSHTRPDVEKPPLLDLFNVNISHYRSSADLEHGRHFTALPTPVVEGVNTDGDEGSAPPSLEIGSATAWLLPVGAKAHMLEFNGTGLKTLETALAEKTELMVTLGARMIEPNTKRTETAEALRLRQAGDFASLNTISETVGSVLTQTLRLIAWWAGKRPTPNDTTITVELNKDYFESRLTPAMLTSLIQAWQAGGMAFRDLYFNLIRGETIDPEREYDDVKKEVTEEVDLRLKSQLAAGGATHAGGVHPRVQQGNNSPTQAASE